MPTVTNSVLIAGPGASVFAAIEDPKVQMTFDEMIRSVDKVTDGPIGKGTRFRGEFKGFGKVEYEYIDFEAGRLVVHGVKMPFGQMQHRFEVAPEGSGSTRLVQSITAELNLLGKILWPIMMRRNMTARVTTLNALIKKFVESTPAS